MKNQKRMSYANSMAMIPDDVHTFSDFTAILIAYFAFCIGRKKVFQLMVEGGRSIKVVMGGPISMVNVSLSYVYHLASSMVMASQKARSLEICPWHSNR